MHKDHKKNECNEQWCNPKINDYQYAHVKDLGGGRQAHSFIATRNGDNAIYVIKHYYNSSQDEFKKKLERAKREIEIIEKISARNDCFPKYVDAKIHDDNKNIDIVMSFVQGKPLDEYLRSEQDIDKRLEIYNKIINAVSIFHNEGYYHRDLKPDNILVKNDDEIVILDFGLSINTNTNQHAISLLEKRLGPLFFQCPESEVISPEIDFEKIGARFDLYPLGKLLYYIITYNKKFHGCFPREKYGHYPWRLTGEICIFQPVIASVVTSTIEAMTIKNIEEFARLFSEYLEMFKANKGSKDKNLETKILKDENVHYEKERIASKKISIMNTEKIKTKSKEIINQKIEKAMMNPDAFRISNNNLIIDAYALKKFEGYNSIFLKFTITYCNFHKTSLHIVVIKHDNPDIVALKILIYILGIKAWPERIEKEYKPDFILDNTSLLSIDDITANIESWLKDFEAYIKSLIDENYEIWKKLYNKEHDNQS